MNSINLIHLASLPTLESLLIHAGSRRRSFHSPGGGGRLAREFGRKKRIEPESEDRYRAEVAAINWSEGARPGVAASSHLTFAGVAFLLAAVGLVATLIPALRATQVDPLVALRYE